MATAALIPIEEYLHTGYERDVEYVDGELRERPAVFSVHGLLQGLLVSGIGRERGDRGSLLSEFSGFGPAS